MSRTIEMAVKRLKIIIDDVYVIQKVSFKNFIYYFWGIILATVGRSEIIFLI